MIVNSKTMRNVCPEHRYIMFSYPCVVIYYECMSGIPDLLFIYLFIFVPDLGLWKRKLMFLAKKYQNSCSKITSYWVMPFMLKDCLKMSARIYSDEELTRLLHFALKWSVHVHEVHELFNQYAPMYIKIVAFGACVRQRAWIHLKVLRLIPPEITCADSRHNPPARAS